jgi:hypothetical protein
VSPKHGSSNLVKRSKLVVRQVEPNFSEAAAIHKTMKLSPPHVGLDSGQFLSAVFFRVLI